MAYRIGPEDRHYVEEFRARPIGHHSAGLARVLNTLRRDPSGRQLVLLTLTPFQEWAIAWLPQRRGDQVVIESNRIFTSREEAEWAVFCRRWERHTGERIG